MDAQKSHFDPVGAALWVDLGTCQRVARALHFWRSESPSDDDHPLGSARGSDHDHLLHKSVFPGCVRDGSFASRSARRFPDA